MSPDPTPSVWADEVRERLQWAAAILGRYGGPVTATSSEPVFTHLPALSGALRWVAREGNALDVRAALPVADALGAAWERLGELRTGRACLDALLEAVDRQGVEDSLDVARVLRRRARLAMRARLDDLAARDLERAYAIASLHDDPLTVSVMLDRVDLAVACGDWAAATDVVPELLRRTQDSGDALLQAMGLNRCAWAALCSGDLAVARERYERAWSLVGLHEDGIVESRTAAGLATLAAREGDLEGARAAWATSLALAERLHDRAFVLHCLDGIAVLLMLRGDRYGAAELLAASTATREHLAQPREVAVEALAEQVRAGAPPVSRQLAYVEALAAARAAVATP